MSFQKKIRIAFADDHSLLRKGLVKLLLTYGSYESLFDVDNGEQVIQEIKQHKIPDVLILDVNMEGKNGIETAQWVSSHYPQIKILALSMYNDEETIMKMLQAGAHGYITKNSEPEKLQLAINTVYEKGVYLPESLSAKLLSGIKNRFINNHAPINITPQEKEFLKLLCKELSNKEIAEKMFLSPRTIEDYRKKLTKKLNVKGKTGLIIYAINNGMKG